MISRYGISKMEFQSFEHFWGKVYEEKTNEIPEPRKMVIKKTVAPYNGCVFTEGTTFIFKWSNDSYRILSQYSYPVTAIKINYDKESLESINNEKFSLISKFVEGVFRKIDIINEVEVTDFNTPIQVPILKPFIDKDIGIMEFFDTARASIFDFSITIADPKEVVG